MDTVETVEQAEMETVIAFTPSNGRSAFERLLGRRRRLLAQGGGDAGTRLDRVFEVLFERHRRPVVAVEGDQPGLTRERLAAADAALAGADAVLGPSTGGGVTLVGLRAPRPGLLLDVDWSSASALEAARARFAEAGLEVVVLEPERSLETPADLFEWYAGARAARLAETHPRASSTLHALLPPRRFAALEEAVGPREG